MEHRYKVDFRPKPAFLIDAYFWMGCRRIFILGFIVVVLGIGGHLVLNSIALMVMGIIGASLITVFAGVWIWRRRVAIRRIRAEPDQWLCDYAVMDDGLHYQTPLGEGMVRWGFQGEVKKLGPWWAVVSREVGILPLGSDLPEPVRQFIVQRLQNKGPAKATATAKT